MKYQASLLALLSTLAFSAVGATPPPSQLLAADTLGFMTIPDYAGAKRTSGQWPVSQLWQDPAIKPFKEKLLEKLRNDLLQPLEKEFGIRFADYAGLGQGQVTLAITPNGWDGKSSQQPSFLLLIDVGDKGDVLRTNLTRMKQRWVDSGKQIKPQTIQDVEFTTLMFSSADLSASFEKIFPDPAAGYETLKPPKPKKPGKPLQWLLGQSGSLMILGGSVRDIEKILIRQKGGAVPSLAEHAAFAANYSGHLRNSLQYGWINLKTIVDTLAAQAAAKSSANSKRNPSAPTTTRIMEALGLMNLNALSWSIHDQPEGCYVNLHIDVPEANRKGIVKLLTFDAKDAAPPPFVPADAVKFSRCRLDMQKVWATLEAMIAEAAPQVAGIIKLVMDNAGKDKDPNFDLRQNLIANLGDDLISYEKSPRTETLANLRSPPSLFLLSSPRPAKLADALKALTSIMPQQSTPVKEREFLGRKVYTMGLPSAPDAGGGAPVQRSLHFAPSGSYVALSTDVVMLEEYLRSSAGTAKSLRQTPGLAAAADHVGGMGTGLFGYENQTDSTRAAWAILKKESGNIANLFSSTSLAGRLGISEGDNLLKDWVDFSLLPPFDRISKYFHFSVWSGSVNADGIRLKVFTPTPPQLRQ